MAPLKWQTLMIYALIVDVRPITSATIVSLLHTGVVALVPAAHNDVYTVIFNNEK